MRLLVAVVLHACCRTVLSDEFVRFRTNVWLNRSSPAAAAESEGCNLVAECTCAKAMPDTDSVPTLSPCALEHLDITMLTVTSTQNGLLEAVSHFVGPPDEATLLPASRAPLSCMDHRSPYEIVGSYGGDFVEMLMAMSAVETEQQKPLELMEVERFVSTYIQKSRAPYIMYHTDVEAVAFILHELGAYEVDFMLLAKPLRTAVLEIFRQPASHGCAILRAIVANPKLIGLREQLLWDSLSVVHGILWSPENPLRKRLKYVIYSPERETASTWPGSSAVSFSKPARSLLLAPNVSCSVYDLPRRRARGLMTSIPSVRSVQEAADTPLQVRLLVDDEGEASTVVKFKAVLEISVSDECDQRRKTAIPIAPWLAHEAQPKFLVLHPSVYLARRNATSSLLAGLFGVDVHNVQTSLLSLGREWQLCFDRALGLGTPDFPKVQVTFR